MDSPLGTRLVRSCRPLPEPGASAGNSAGRSRTCQTPLIQRLTWSQQHEEVEKDEEGGGRCLGPNPGPGFWEEAPATASAAADISQNQ